MLHKSLPSYSGFLSKPLDMIAQNHFPHAVLLNSVDGAPSIFIAKILAQAILCENPESHGCGSCNSCIMVEKNNHPDICFSFPFISKGKTTNCSEYIQEWNEFTKKRPIFLSQEWVEELDAGNKQLKIFTAESERLHKFQSLKPYLGKKKVIILYQSELLHNSTANKLLKSIEEPLEDTHILIITHSVENTLPTITSRCQIINLPPVTESDIRKDISSLGMNLDTDILPISQGNLGLYNYMLTHKEELISSGENFMSWLRDCFKSDVKSLMTSSESLSKQGREHLLTVILSYLMYFRDAFVNPNETSGIHASVMIPTQKLAKFVHEGNSNIIYDYLHLLIGDLKRNANPKIALLDTSIKISQAIKL